MARSAHKDVANVLLAIQPAQTCLVLSGRPVPNDVLIFCVMPNIAANVAMPVQRGRYVERGDVRKL